MGTLGGFALGTRQPALPPPRFARPRQTLASYGGLVRSRSQAPGPPSLPRWSAAGEGAREARGVGGVGCPSRSPIVGEAGGLPTRPSRWAMKRGPLGKKKGAVGPPSYELCEVRSVLDELRILLDVGRDQADQLRGHSNDLLWLVAVLTQIPV